MEHSVYLALGSNMGDREDYLQQAVFLLQESVEINVLSASSLYETEPVGYTEQAAFLNMVVQVETTLTPLELLKQTQKIELELGRKRDVRFGPRTVDLDILLYGQVIMEMDELQIPHPRMWDRGFVLVPLAEIAPQIYSETYRRTLRELCAEQLIDKEGVNWWKRWNGVGAYVHSES